MSPPRAACALVIPAFDAAETIGETLRSLQEQRWGLDRLRAVVVADDASRDTTSSVALAAWRLSSPTLRLSRNACNMGERNTINAAVARLDPDVGWLLLLHADDLVKPHWLPSMLEEIDQASPRTASFCASYDVLHPDGSVTPGEEDLDRGLVLTPAGPRSVSETLRRGCWWKVSSCAIRRAAFEELGGFRPDLPQQGDWDFLIRLLAHGWDVGYIPRALSVYRQHEQSVSSTSFRTHRDVVESLDILRRFGRFLDRRSLAERHAFLLRCLARRAMKSALASEWPRARQALALGPLVGHRLAGACLARR